MFAMYALVPKVEEEEEEEENRRRRRRRVCVTEWKRKSLLGTFAKAESGCLSLLSRLGPVPRAAEEPETPLPLQLAGVSKEWKLVRRKDYLAKIWRSLLKSGFWKSLWSKLQQLITICPQPGLSDLLIATINSGNLCCASSWKYLCAGPPSKKTTVLF
ncbi:uncharacterized protein PHA67_015015 isoform 3-T3 [Liasis olivaceus]